jgi:hypothetical protein
MTKTTRNLKGNVDTPSSGRQGYCGPAAVTCITGKRYDIVEKEMLKLWNSELKHPNAPKKTMVQGMNISWMGKYLRRWHNVQRLMAPTHEHVVDSYWSEKRTTTLNPTVAQFLRRRSPTVKKHWVLLWTRDHFMLCKGNKVWDNWMRKDGVSPSRTHFKRARVESAFIVKYRGTHWDTLDVIDKQNNYRVSYYDEMEFNEVNDKTLFNGTLSAKAKEHEKGRQRANPNYKYESKNYGL